MFTKYNINDLYLAYVLDITPKKDSVIPYSSVGYLTILKKNGENYIDLQNKDRIVESTIRANKKCFAVYEIEPLSKHYNKEGKRINQFTRKKALNTGHKYRHIISEKISERTKVI